MKATCWESWESRLSTCKINLCSCGASIRPSVQPQRTGRIALLNYISSEVHSDFVLRNTWLAWLAWLAWLIITPVVFHFLPNQPSTGT